jgi:hypothetical protein
VSVDPTTLCRVIVAPPLASDGAAIDCEGRNEQQTQPAGLPHVASFWVCAHDSSFVSGCVRFSRHAVRCQVPVRIESRSAQRSVTALGAGCRLPASIGMTRSVDFGSAEAACVGVDVAVDGQATDRRGGDVLLDRERGLAGGSMNVIAVLVMTRRARPGLGVSRPGPSFRFLAVRLMSARVTVRSYVPSSDGRAACACVAALSAVDVVALVF